MCSVTNRRDWKRLFGCFLVGLAVCALASVANAGTITFSGIITQAQDPSVPAVNNTSLNSISVLDAYAVTLVFPGDITTPGTYLGSTTLTFNDPFGPASESSFSSISLTITLNAGYDEFSLLGCLSTGSSCGSGNQLDANFKILAASLNSQNVSVIGLDQPHPLDLLEDDGSTDIQGSITNYSYIGAIPEPSLGALSGVVLAVFLFANRVSRKRLPRKKEKA